MDGECAGERVEQRLTPERKRRVRKIVRQYLWEVLGRPVAVGDERRTPPLVLPAFRYERRIMTPAEAEEAGGFVLEVGGGMHADPTPALALRPKDPEAARRSYVKFERVERTAAEVRALIATLPGHLQRPLLALAAHRAARTRTEERRSKEALGELGARVYGARWGAPSWDDTAASGEDDSGA